MPAVLERLLIRRSRPPVPPATLCSSPGLATRRQSVILPSSITNEVEALVPVPAPQSPPGRSVSSKVAVVKSPVVFAATSVPPQGRLSLKAIASSAVSSFVSTETFSTVLGIAK